MSSIARKPPSSMTADEFLTWDGDGTKYELVDGTLRAMSPGSATHGLIQANLAALLKSHLAGSRCGS